MSDTAYRLLLMKRALARSDAELFGHRPRYLEVVRRLAALLLSTDLPRRSQDGGSNGRMDRAPTMGNPWRWPYAT